MASELWTPPGANLGYNMPSDVEQDQPAAGAPAGAPQGGGFWGKVKAGVSASVEERQPNAKPFGDTTKPTTTAGLNAFDPSGRALAGWEATKWAFRGTRTTPNPQSEAGEQNLLGGVSRDVIPTRRIQTQPMGTPSSAGQGQARERLNKEAEETSVYPRSGGGGVGGAGAMQPPSPIGGMPQQPQVGAPASFGASEDPLFAKNTGSMPFNAMQFGNLHQRQVAGGQ